jgi:hypothetical protein
MTDFVYLFRFLIGLLSVAAVVEVLTSTFWLPVYYRRGIRLQHYKVLGHLPPDRSLPEILDCSNTGFRFCSITTREVAFRDPLVNFHFKQAPMIHGSIRYDGSKIEIQELANWTPLYAILLFSIFGASGILLIGSGGVISVFVAGLMVISWTFSYRSQQRRLDDLADELRANLLTTP